MTKKEKKQKNTIKRRKIMANTNDMNAPTKVPCGGFVLGEGLALSKDGKTLNVTGGGVQSDWNQNDETAKDYIKNRPFYTGDTVESIIYENVNASFSKSYNSTYIHTEEFAYNFPETNKTYNIMWDGVLYTCSSENSESKLIGNLSLIGNGNDTGEPFVMGCQDGTLIIFTNSTAESHSISIGTEITNVIQIDRQYIPSPILSINPSKEYTIDEVKAIVDNIANGSFLYRINGSYVLGCDTYFTGNDSAYAKFVTYDGRVYTMSPSSDIWTFSNIDTKEYITNIFLKDSKTRIKLGNIADITDDGRIIAISLGDESANNNNAAMTGFMQAHTLIMKALGSSAESSAKYLWITANSDGKITVKQCESGSRTPIFERSIFQNGEDSITLKSSTEGSEKQFKITVDDSGAIKATEVTI